MSTKTPVTVEYGGGIGPQIMRASLHDVARPSLDTKKLVTAAGKANGDGRKLTMIDNRVEVSRCHFSSVALFGHALDQGIEIVKTEPLGTYNGNVGYSLAQGQ